MSTRYTLEWVWQPHSNPVTITSPDHAVFSQKGGNFTVEAKGKSPLVFSLKDGVPEGVAIDKSSGVMTVPAGLPEGNYVFTVVAKESEPPIAVNPLLIFDEYREDTSPPDEQVFTLIIDNTDAQVPTETSTPSETPELNRRLRLCLQLQHRHPQRNLPLSGQQHAPNHEKPPTTPQTSTADGTSHQTPPRVLRPLKWLSQYERLSRYEFTRWLEGDLSVRINASGGGILISRCMG